MVVRQTHEMVIADERNEDRGLGSKIKWVRSGSRQSYRCYVNCLDGTMVTHVVARHELGEVLLDQVVDELGIVEKECVGFQFTNEKGVVRWLDIHKPMKHQLGISDDVILAFRFKFYDPDPVQIEDAYVRHLLYLQLREDVAEGKLKCNERTYALLGSYAVQQQLGDHDKLIGDTEEYLNQFTFSPYPSSQVVKRVRELHQDHRGQTASRAEINYLKVAKKTPRYGVDVHMCRDVEGEVEIGVSADGIYVYRMVQQEYLFRWQVVDVVLYSRRKFTVKLKHHVPKTGEESDEEDGTAALEVHTKKHQQPTFVFVFTSATRCKQCYKACVEHHTFFRLARPGSPRKKRDSFRIGSSFRYSDRTLYQLRTSRNKKSTPGHHDGTLLRDSMISECDDEANDVIAVGIESPPLGQIASSVPSTPQNNGAKRRKKMQQRVTRTTVTPIGGRPISVCMDEVPSPQGIETREHGDGVEIKTLSERDAFGGEWEAVERVEKDGSVRRFQRRVVRSLITTVEKVHGQLMRDGTALHMEEFELHGTPGLPGEEDSEEYEVVALDGHTSALFTSSPPQDCEVVERTAPDGSTKTYIRRVLPPSTAMEGMTDDMADWHLDSDEWEVITLTDDASKPKHGQDLFLITVHNKHEGGDNKQNGEGIDNEDMGVHQSARIMILEHVNEEKPSVDVDSQTDVWDVSLADGSTARFRKRCVDVTSICRKDEALNRGGGGTKVYVEDYVANESAVLWRELTETESKIQEDGEAEEWQVTFADGTQKVFRRRKSLDVVNMERRMEYGIRKNRDEVQDRKDDVNIVFDSEADGGENTAVVQSEQKFLDISQHQIITVGRKPKAITARDVTLHVKEIETVHDLPEHADFYRGWEVVERAVHEANSTAAITNIISNEDESSETKKVYNKIVTKIYNFGNNNEKESWETPLVDVEEVEVYEVEVEEEEVEEGGKWDEGWEVSERSMEDGEVCTVRSRTHFTVITPHEIGAPLECSSQVSEEKKCSEEEGNDVSDITPENHEEEPICDSVDVIMDGIDVPIVIVEDLTLLESMPPQERQEPIPDEIEGDAVDVVDEVNEPRKKKKMRRLRSSITTVFPYRGGGGATTAPNDDIKDKEIIDDVTLPEVHIQPTNGRSSDKFTSLVQSGLEQTASVFNTTSRNSSSWTIEKKEGSVPLLWEEMELNENDGKRDSMDGSSWELFEKTLPDGSRKPYKRRHLNVVTIHKKPKSITAGHIPLHVREVEVVQDIEDNHEIDLSDWQIVEKTFSDGRKRKFHRHIVTTIFNCGGAVQNPPITVTELELYDVLAEEEDEEKVFPSSDWTVEEKSSPQYGTCRVRSRTKMNIIFPNSLLTLEDKSMAEITPPVGKRSDNVEQQTSDINDMNHAHEEDKKERNDSVADDEGEVFVATEHSVAGNEVVIVEEVVVATTAAEVHAGDDEECSSSDEYVDALSDNPELNTEDDEMCFATPQEQVLVASLHVQEELAKPVSSDEAPLPSKRLSLDKTFLEKVSSFSQCRTMQNNVNNDLDNNNNNNNNNNNSNSDNIETNDNKDEIDVSSLDKNEEATMTNQDVVVATDTHIEDEGMIANELIKDVDVEGVILEGGDEDDVSEGEIITLGEVSLAKGDEFVAKVEEFVSKVEELVTNVDVVADKGEVDAKENEGDLQVGKAVGNDDHDVVANKDDVGANVDLGVTEKNEFFSKDEEFKVERDEVVVDEGVKIDGAVSENFEIVPNEDVVDAEEDKILRVEEELVDEHETFHVMREPVWFEDTLSTIQEESTLETSYSVIESWEIVNNNEHSNPTSDGVDDVIMQESSSDSTLTYEESQSVGPSSEQLCSTENDPPTDYPHQMPFESFVTRNETLINSFVTDNPSSLESSIVTEDSSLESSLKEQSGSFESALKEQKDVHAADIAPLGVLSDDSHETCIDDQETVVNSIFSIDNHCMQCDEGISAVNDNSNNSSSTTELNVDNDINTDINETNDNSNVSSGGSCADNSNDNKEKNDEADSNQILEEKEESKSNESSEKEDTKSTGTKEKKNDSNSTRSKKENNGNKNSTSEEKKKKKKKKKRSSKKKAADTEASTPEGSGSGTVGSGSSSSTGDTDTGGLSELEHGGGNGATQVVRVAIPLHSGGNKTIASGDDTIRLTDFGEL